MKATMESKPKENLGVTYEEKKEAIQVSNKEVKLEAILEAKKDTIMEAHLGINLEAKLEAIFNAKL
jgi:hypothetical protein